MTDIWITIGGDFLGYQEYYCECGQGIKLDLKFLPPCKELMTIQHDDYKNTWKIYGVAKEQCTKRSKTTS